MIKYTSRLYVYLIKIQLEKNVKFNLFLLNFQQLNNFCNLLELQCALRCPIGTRLIWHNTSQQMKNIPVTGNDKKEHPATALSKWSALCIFCCSIFCGNNSTSYKNKQQPWESLFFQDIQSWVTSPLQMKIRPMIVFVFRC